MVFNGLEEFLVGPAQLQTLKIPVRLVVTHRRFMLPALHQDYENVELFLPKLFTSKGTASVGGRSECIGRLRTFVGMVFGKWK